MFWDSALKETIFVNIERPSRNRGGALRHSNDILGSLRRKLHNHSQQAVHDDNDRLHPFHDADDHQWPLTNTNNHQQLLMSESYQLKLETREMKHPDETPRNSSWSVFSWREDHYFTIVDFQTNIK